MLAIDACPLPAHSLLDGYRKSGAYTDCYATRIGAPVSLASYVEAFYTTPLFRIERLILKLALSRPSTDADAVRLAAGTAEAFAAWRVEGRAANELLLCDVFGRTRSWLMVAPEVSGAQTRLCFGSAVVPTRDPRTGRAKLGLSFHALLGFHRVYSQLLLYSARVRLESHLRRGEPR